MYASYSSPKAEQKALYALILIYTILKPNLLFNYYYNPYHKIGIIKNHMVWQVNNFIGYAIIIKL